MKSLAHPLAMLTLAILTGCTGGPPPAPRHGVVVVGDGRTATDPAVPMSLGWGRTLGGLLRAGTAFRDASSPTGRIAQALDPAALAAIEADRPAVVVAGFGQGDADAGTDPVQFRADLDQWIRSLRAKGVALLLVTPPVLRTNDPVSGRPPAGFKPARDAAPFAKAIVEAAAAAQVPCFDLRAAMERTYREIGDRANWFIHPPFDAAKEYPSNVREHKKWRSPVIRNPAYFSDNGAESLAHWVALDLRENRHPLAALLRPVDGPPTPDYERVWADEFDGTQWDTNSWICRYPGKRKDGINDPACLRLDGQGHLVIDVKKVGDAFHSGMISTAQRREWTHGYFECRTTLAQAEGYWNAFWLMGDKVSAPMRDPSLVDQTRRNGVEIDVLEYLRKQGDVVHMNLHWNGYNEFHRSSPYDVFVPGLREREWHVFGVEWTTDGYTFYVDGRPMWRTADGPSDASKHIILSVEIGKWAGDIAQAALPQAVKIDWVRVWQKKPVAAQHP